ncbi:MAG: hypothetical protein ABSE28_09965 [Candidatus Sulfotelmatobacter sp.]|jgi:hypothetical protein
MKFETVKNSVARRSGPVLAGLGVSARTLPPLPLLLLFTLLTFAVPLAARDKEKVSYGEGLIVNIPVPAAEVEQVVQDVAQNGVIRGTKEYNKDEFVAGAKVAESSNAFPAWDQGGKVIYKVRTQAIDPRNFKDSSDVGTLAVRYVVLPQGENNTVLRIDALFKEDFRHIVHPSNGSVENAEYKDIREHLDGIEFMKAQDIEAQRERREQLAKKRNLAVGNDAAPPATGQSSSQPELQAAENDPVPAAAPATATQEPPEVSSSAPPDQPLEERIKDLRKQVVRLVKSPGAPLKSAPFHTAGTLQLLGTGTEVLIVINSPYWYGVETHEGQHGWVLRDQLELLP